MKKRLLQLRGKEIVLAKESLNENMAVAVDFIASQLAQGIKKDGTKSTFGYARKTVRLKKGNPGLSGVTSYLTNFDTGESYKKLYGKVEGDLIEFGTKTDKEDAISGRMDDQAFGLAPDNKEEFVRQHIKGSFIKKVKDIVKI